MPALQCLLAGDLLPWERDYFETFLKGLETRCTVVRRITDDCSPVWIVARDARKALEAIPRGFKPTVFVSVLTVSAPPTWFGLFPRRRRVRPDLTLRWIAHTDFAFRFLKEMEGVAADRLSALPLPGLLGEPNAAKSPRALHVGVLTALTADANLSFLISVVHYVNRAGRGIRFVIPSTGKLSEHLILMARDLGLESAFVTHDESSPDPDLVLFAPLKTEHFVGILWAGARGIPVLTADVPGVEGLVSDGQDGFILPVNEVKPVGELILRLDQDSVFRTALGDRLRQSLAKRLPLDRLLNHFQACFFEPAASVVHVAA